MKKIILIAFISIFANHINAQLEVNDTVLMVLKNDVFWSASSELEPGSHKDLGKYGSVNLGDNDMTSCWAEGSENNGTGESIYITIPNNVDKIKIRNGFQKTEGIYYANNRPQDVKFTLYASYQPSGFITETHTGIFISEKLYTSEAMLEDKMGYQEVDLGINWPEVYTELYNDHTFNKDRFVLKITIESIYKGTKWNDACISDIKIIPKPFFELSEDEHGLLKKLENKIDTLFYNPEYIYQVIELSSDLEWLIFIEMPSEIEGRTETVYKLYNTQKEGFISSGEIVEMYGFEEENGELYLLGTDKDFNDIRIKLSEL